MKRVAWLIPEIMRGSGGLRTIFSHVENLCQEGIECHAYVDCGERKFSAAAIHKKVEDYYGPCSAVFHSGLEIAEKVDVIIATAWNTAHAAANSSQDCPKAYFIQDLEPLFYPMGDDYLRAEQTYRLGLIPITIGKWLASKMSKEYSVAAGSFDFTADLNVYRPLDGMKREKAVCFIYQPGKPRRCGALGMEALRAVKHYCPDVTIYLYGSNRVPQTSFACDHLGLMPIEQCNRLYNRCMVGLCISSTNPSRIPFEMLAAGLPVVDVYRESTLYDFPERAMLLAQASPHSLAEALIMLLSDQNLRSQMSAAGMNFMRQRPKELEFSQFAAAIESLFAGQKPETIDEIVPIYARSAIVSKRVEKTGPICVQSVVRPSVVRRMADLMLPKPVQRYLRSLLTTSPR
jgi:WsaF, C-terminal domain/WsaF, N-terminal domain